MADRDYADLIKTLRYCSEYDNCGSRCPRFESNGDGDCVDGLMKDAADAIEELQGKLKELYYLTCDINKNEINAQTEWGNLDNFLRAFRKYADKIAGVELPDPPKGVE